MPVRLLECHLGDGIFMGCRMKMKVKMIFVVLLLLTAAFAFLGKKIFDQTLHSTRATYYGDVPIEKDMGDNIIAQISSFR